MYQSVAGEHVAEYGRLVPKNSVFPINSELHRTHLLKRSKKWPMFAKFGLTSFGCRTNFNRTINLYICQPYYPYGIRSFIAAAASTMSS
jgi:hypothetical protein